MVNSLAEEADPPPHQLRVRKRGKSEREDQSW